jgi:RNA polymerase sigma-70 factor, ECF subfamily
MLGSVGRGVPSTDGLGMASRLDPGRRERRRLGRRVEVDREGRVVLEMDEDDRALMQRFQDAGDAEAFERLFERHTGALYRFLLRLSGSPAVAEDVSQQTWLKLLELAERGGYRADAPFRSALYALARNRYVDEHVRGHASARSVSLDDPDVGELAAEGEDLGALLERRESRDAVDRALAALPPAQREVIALWMHGFELGEVAHITGDGWHTVVSRKRYALAKLRRALATLEDGSGRGA